MDQLGANSGTTNPATPGHNWFLVTQQQDIINALNTIIQKTISCSFDLTTNAANGTPDYTRSSVVVTISGTPQTLARTDYTISQTASRTTLTVGTAVCNQLRAAAGTSPPPKVEVRTACVSTCPGKTEICGNLIDDNCNGQTDEGCNDTCVCGDPRPTCPKDCGVGCVPKPEICNKVDDNCDGKIDEGCCVPKTEICGNNIDDDCDGTIDEDCACGPEVCDGKDNNCDGTIDEGCPPPGTTCTCGVVKPGCESVLLDCPPPGCTPELEVCDGKDNNCNGQIDEGCCVPTTTDDQCDGIDNNCNGKVDEGCLCGPEICDGIDNNCNGKVDEGCPPKIQ